jgi:hypothetical protein
LYDREVNGGEFGMFRGIEEYVPGWAWNIGGWRPMFDLRGTGIRGGPPAVPLLQK